MHRTALAAGRSNRVAVLTTALAIFVAACAGTDVPASGTGQPSAAPSGPTASARSSPPPAGSASPGSSATGGPFDAAGLTVTLERVASVPGGPLAFAAPADGSHRLFVAAKDGRAWVLRDGTVGKDPLLDIRSLVSTGGEQGLLGIAVPPTFPADPRVFVDYTDVRGDTVVAAYRLADGASDRLDPASAAWILTVDQPYANHNGGALAFGPDGMLYVSLGDGGSGGDPLGNGQRTDTLLGKILRLDVRPASTPNGPYAVPTDNPFVGVTGARPEIWQFGLRNPWRFSFDRTTGDLWIGDVGQDRWEEVDVARAGVGGLNFGWNAMEGRHCYSPLTDCRTSGITLPVVEYGHDAGCTVIGGTVYRGEAQPQLRGGYLYADYCSGTMWAVPATTDGSVKPVEVGNAGSGIAAFGEDAAGELYAANLDGTISTLVAARR